MLSAYFSVLTARQNQIAMKKQVKDIMTSPVVTAEIGAPVSFIRELMERKNVNAIPIVELDDDEINVKGIVTATDLRGIQDETTPVEMVMTENVQVIPKRTSIQAAAAAMLRNEVHHLVVLHKGSLIGIISSLDFTRIVAEMKVNTFSRVMLW